MEIKIDKEAAEAEFERFCEFAQIDLEEPRNENDRTSVDESKAKFVHFVMKGKITVDEDGHPVVHTDHPDLQEVRFNRLPMGNDYCAMDKVKSSNEMGKLYAMISSTTGVASALLRKLSQPDFKAVSLVFTLFLE